MTTQAIGELLCSRGHRNPGEHRYCQYCGEKLKAPEPAQPKVVGDRYRIMREIGRGGFGHTYLAEDTSRFNEACVLKEFAPELDHPESIHKAKELFSREAEVLYRLEHPQIPKFRAWFMDEKLQSLFLAQDYITGPTYFALLQKRKAQGLAFTQDEVLNFLRHSLPILDYIHDQGVIHRDISPDNLICRQSDQRPVLIDFGGVKQVTITLGKWRPNDPDKKQKNITLIGKPSYAPEEQIRLGQVNPSSDIYALGVTALALLMGKEPQEFYDSYQQRFNWRGSIEIMPHFAAILEKMTAPRASDRYRSAAQVLSDLPEPTSSGLPQPNPTPQTVLVSPAQSAGNRPSSTTNTALPASPNTATNSGTAVVSTPVASRPGFLERTQRTVVSGVLGLLKMLLILMGLLGLGALGWWLVQTRLDDLPDPFERDRSAESNPSTQSASQAEFILNRVDELNIPNSYFNRVTNEAYYLRYPDQQGRLLSQNNPEDRALRDKWYSVAQQVLQFSEQLSQPSRSRLGRFGTSDLRQIESILRKKQINQQRFLRDVEQDLLKQLPMYRDQSLGGQQVNQLRLALASERASSL